MPTLNSDGLIVTEKRVALLPYRARPFIPREFMTEDEIRSNAGSVLALDVECYPNYFECGFKHLASGKFIRLDGDFNPQFLSWLLFSYQTTGFNSIDYDLPMLWAAFINRNPEFLKSVSNGLILSGERTKDIASRFGFKLYPLPERQHVDLISVCPLEGSLKLYGARLHSKRIQDLPYPDTKHLTPEEIEIVCNYNYNDLDVTELVFNFCKERLELRTALSIEYHEDLMSKSDAQIAEAVIPKEVGKLNKKWVKRPEIDPGTVYKYSVPSYIGYATPQMQELLRSVKRAEFVVQENGKIELPPELDVDIRIGNSVYRLGIGGLHSSEKCITYRTNSERVLIDRDVVSYYPNILLNLGLYPIALGPNFLKVFRGFKEQRVTAKARKDFTKDKGLKIFLNGMSGKLSDNWSKMRSPDLTIQMTVTGQLSLLMFIEMLECNGIQVVSANTDGIVIYPQWSQLEQLNYWVKYWEKLTGFDTEETRYDIYCARDINAYFAVKSEGFFDVKKKDRVKVKGPYSEVGSQSGTQLDTNPATLICSDALKLFLSEGIPYKKTIMECKNLERFITVQNVKSPGAAFRGEYLGKVIRFYYAKNTKDAILRVASGHQVANTEGAMPVMDMPDELPKDLDYQYYIDKCKKILIEIGYTIQPKQVKFF